MKIIIKEANKEKLNEAIRTAQGKCETRIINADDLFEMIEEIEKKLGIPKYKMKGIKVSADYHAQQFCSAYLRYNHMPESTRVELEKVSKGWALTEVKRRICRAPSNRYLVTLTDEAKEAIIKSKEHFG